MRTGWKRAWVKIEEILVKRSGFAALRSFLGKLDCVNQHQKNEVMRQFERVFGATLAETEAAWRSSLKS